MRRGVCRQYRERWRNLGCSKIITLSTQWQFFPLGQIRVWIMPKYCLAPLDQSPITLCMIDLFWHIVIVIYSEGIYIGIVLPCHVYLYITHLAQAHKKGGIGLKTYLLQTSEGNIQDVGILYLFQSSWDALPFSVKTVGLAS